jgi:AraC family transcriptional regulator
MEMFPVAPGADAVVRAEPRAIGTRAGGAASPPPRPTGAGVSLLGAVATLAHQRDWGSVDLMVYDRHTSDEITWQSDRHTIMVAATDPERGGITPSSGPADRGRLWPGALVMHPAGLRSESWSGPARWVHVRLDQELFRPTELDTVGGRSPDFQLRGAFADPLVEEVVRSLVREAIAGLSDRILVDSLAQLLALKLARGAGVAIERASPGLSHARRRRVIDHIEAHLGEELSLARLAGVACLSACHFSRSFGQAMGRSLPRYVTERRVARAKSLLRPGGPSLAEIAVMLGFGDQAHFTNVFRRATGMTPGRFRAALA